MASLRKCKGLISDDEEQKRKQRVIVARREKIGLAEENEKVVIEIGEEEQIEIIIVIKRKEIDEEEQIEKEGVILRKRNEIEEVDIDKKVVISLRKKKLDEEGQIDKEGVILINRNEFDKEEKIEKEKELATKGKEIYEEENTGKVIFKKRNVIDEEEPTGKERRVIIKKRKDIDEAERINKEKVSAEKRTKIDEEEENEKESRVIAKEIEEEEQNEKERLFGKKGREIDDEEQDDKVRAVGNQMDDDYSPPCKNLPEDLMMDSILMRLPARTLAVCSCVSKLCFNTVYSDTRFASSHFVQNQNYFSLGFSLFNIKMHDTVKGYLFSFEKEDQDDAEHDVTLYTDLTTRNISELVGHCNGLVCIKLLSEPTDETGIVSVVSRTRCQILSLSYSTPTSTGELCKYLCHGFGFDSVSQVYKVVLIFTSKAGEEFVCTVFTLGTNSWRTITTSTTEISLPPGSFASPVSQLATSVERMSGRQATLCGDDLFWKTTNEVGNNSEIEMLLSFDLHNEKIQFIRLPTECALTATTNWHQYLVVDHLLEFKGYPCIARSEKMMISNSDHTGHRCNDQSSFCCCCCCCKVHLYILKDKVKQIWIEEKTLDVQIKDPEGLLPGPFCCYFGTTTATTMPPPTRILTFHDQVLLYWFNGECVVLYNLHTKHLKVVRCSDPYPDLFRTKLNKLPGHCIDDDDILDMDYQLYAQVDNIVSLETFIPEGETCKFNCFEDLLQLSRKKQPVGWLIPGRGSPKIYTYFSLFFS